VLRRPRIGVRDEGGAVAIMAAVMMVVLLVTAGIVLDFGLARMDRTTNKSAADAAVAAGLQAANNGTGDVYNSTAVCTAYAFLKANRPYLSGLPADVCSTPSSTAICTPGDHTTDMSYHGTTSGSTRFEVWIKMPYSVSDTSTGGAFADESLATQASDPGEATQQGCDQIGVVIKEWTQPGFGRIVSSDEIATRVRSVARVKVGNGDPAPALLLLERTQCGVLAVGSAGSSSRIKVYGGATSPGTIHSDSDASDGSCGSGSGRQLLQGKQADGIVAYGSGDGAPGLISTVATQNGVAAGTIIDSASNVYATSAANESVPGVKQPAPVGRKRVTRKPVDKRYLSGVTEATRAAGPLWALDHSSPAGFTRYGCSPDMAVLSAMTASQSVYIDCPGSGITLAGSIGAGRIYFHGFIKGGVLAMPNATSVFVDDTTNAGGSDSATAISLSNNTAFCVRASICSTAAPTSGSCSGTPTLNANAKARLLVRRGSLSGNGTSSLLRLCNTTAILEGGDIGTGTLANPGGCLPVVWGSAPTATPCASSPTSGDSLINTSGSVDWTAPNAYSDMTATGLSVTAQQVLWDGGEDLSLWDETYGTGPDFQMAGGGAMRVAGVFMVPNALPFNLTGGGAQDLTNAQYVVRGFSVAGGATLTMKVDPNNVVGLPSLYDYRMVR
jgi:Flp pilus assembly protein TadG